ncbi:Glycosyltransferase Family 76 protein, partial [Glomus cerebriforme]
MDQKISQNIKSFTSENISLIFKLSICSRFLTWIIALISTFIVDDYDSSVDTILRNQEESTIQRIFNVCFRVFLRWDTFYFTHISEEGYIYEQEHAFFPMLPLLARGLSNSVFLPLEYFLTYRQILLLSGVLIANISFVLASINLYKLSLLMFNNKEKYALVTSIFYILTPSCMFMSTMYAESLFAFLTFLGMRLFYEGNTWIAAFIWGSSSFARSNGIIYVGFFIYEFLIKDINRINVKVIFVRLIKTTVLSLIVLSGFLIFQSYGYYQYCILNIPQRSWCNNKIPILYLFVQKFYWNCGFLTYYEIKQIPNFLLASPMILLSFYGIYDYSKIDFKRIFTLGLQQQQQRSEITSLYYSHNLLPFIYLWAVLLIYSITSMHIQVITRFFSSQPMVYWFVAHLFMKSLSEDANRSDKILGYGVLTYFILYGVSGIILFANFFPPA